MKLNRTGSNWNELERNKINENWDIIEGLGGSINKVVSGVDWKEPVDTYGDLPTNAEVGETRMVRESIDGVSHVYRYNGEKWELIQEIDATLVNEVDRRLTAQLAEKAEQSDLQSTIRDVSILKAQKASKSELSSGLNSKVDKGGNEQITWGMLDQTTKENITGGNTPVVGVDSVNTTNLVDGSVTTSKRTALGELCFVVTGKGGPYPDFRPQEYRIIVDGSLAIFHRDKRYFITEPFIIDFSDSAIDSATVAIYYDTNTGEFKQYKGFSMRGISENEILFAVYASENGKQVLHMNGEYTTNGSMQNITTERRTSLGELPFISIGRDGGSINLNLSDKKIEFLGTAFIFHRDNRYTIPKGTEVDFSQYESTGYVLFLDTETDEVYIRQQTHLTGISETSIMLGVFNKSVDDWYFQINSSQYTIDGKSPFESNNELENTSHTYSVEPLFGDFPESDFEGVGDENSPFDGNETHETIYNLFDDLLDEQVTREEIGRATDNIPIYAYHSRPIRAPIVEGPQIKPYPEIIMISSIHGGESLSTYSLYYMFKQICERWQSSEQLYYLRNYVNLTLIPLPNPVDFNTKSYIGVDGINLNRDFDYNWSSNREGAGEKPFSRVESRVLRDYLFSRKDNAMLFIDCHVRGGALSDDSMLMWLGSSRLKETRFLSTTIEKLSKKWKEKYTNLNQTTGALGYISTREAPGVVRSYTHNIVGIPSILWEGFKGSPSFPDTENKDVINLNTQYLGETVLNAIKNYQ